MNSKIELELNKTVEKCIFIKKYKSNIIKTNSDFEICHNRFICLMPIVKIVHSPFFASNIIGLSPCVYQWLGSAGPRCKAGVEYTLINILNYRRLRHEKP